MTTKCFIPDPDDKNAIDTPGALIELSLENTDGSRNKNLWAKLSDHYKTIHYSRRPPLALVLPSGELWIMDYIATNAPGWEISGEIPHLTARPSIGASTYHGWLTDGVLSDDLEGRTYDAEGEIS